jgi:nitroreductase
MNQTIQAIKNRRSIKSYQQQQIGDVELETILEAGRLAPNAMNMQQWHFSVIQNEAVLDNMVSIIKENIMSSCIQPLIQRASTPGYHTFHHAPTVVMISGDEKSKFIQIDCGAAAQNMALAAESLNIGSCVMTSPELLFNSDKGKALKKELGIPEGYKFVCALSLGYKQDQPVQPPRNKEVVTYIK